MISKILVIQIGIMILISGSLGGMLLYTNVYEDVKSRIVSILCLGCLKLDPKIQLDFTFKTANGQSHPSFVLDNLTIGPVFLHYRDDVCKACDIMEPIVKEIFGVNYSMEEQFSKTILFNGTNITFIHINIDHTTEEKRKSFYIYYKEHLKAVPMFTIVTLGNNHGFIEPCYMTLYGTLGKDTDEGRREILLKMINDAINIYEQNREGYRP